jgi:ABC-type multidrug transport system ATPase subunit
MILECHDLTYQYPHAESPVLDGLTFSINTPGFHALFGASGTGKTSLAKIISGHIIHTSGRIWIDREIPPLYTYNLERLPDWSQTGKHLNRVTPSDRKALLSSLVSLFEIGDYLTSRFSQLSLGQKNRVNLIRYLLQDFQFLILDESLANVDERTREKIIAGIKDFFPDKCFLYISHNVSEVARYCDHIFILRTAEKKPQLIPLQGQNQCGSQTVGAKALSQTMLEILNAV